MTLGFDIIFFKQTRWWFPNISLIFTPTYLGMMMQFDFRIFFNGVGSTTNSLGVCLIVWLATIIWLHHLDEGRFHSREFQGIFFWVDSNKNWVFFSTRWWFPNISLIFTPTYLGMMMQFDFRIFFNGVGSTTNSLGVCLIVWLATIIWLHHLDEGRFHSREFQGIFFWVDSNKNWVVVSNMFYVHPYLGKIPILTNIFQMGWNHQLENIGQTGFKKMKELLGWVSLESILKFKRDEPETVRSKTRKNAE